MKNRRQVFSRMAGLLSCAVLGVSAMMPAGKAASEPPIKVGVVLPLTSVLAAYGKPYLDAMQMVVDDANSKGGINGRQIELVVEDSQASNTVAINALNKVLQSNPVAVFGPALGTQILAMMPITEKEKVSLIGGPSTRRVSQQGAKFFFRNSPHDAIGKENTTRFLVDTLGKKKIGIMHVGNEWGYSGRDNVTDFLDKLYKLKPVSIASYQPTDKDLTAQILQMQRDGADAIVIQGHPVDEALAMRQTRQLGINVPIVGSGSLCFAYLRNLVDQADISGRYCEAPGAFPSLSANKDATKFAADYKAKTGFEPEIYTLQYYDSMGMLIEVMRKYGVDRDKIREGMSQLSYQGLAGTYKADSEGNLRHDSVIMEFMPDHSVKVVGEKRQS
ncbi:ABC transporter substrate-binding protein [Bradyrhizobium sp. NP1]|uniref:ABC transporter substrate-binding protein n=1 Tax=Bradyrhizobium sp. NP1 TaxID=3049772 RepID=UPI0025A60E43|nr:ABC transporter substrate-binding protein [Bradyrhizobium sp. NP1]WJR80892.1 ABC transporter substrate-binding protein [Bradyrhizobium sp. NP1]